METKNIAILMIAIGLLVSAIYISINYNKQVEKDIHITIDSIHIENETGNTSIHVDITTSGRFTTPVDEYFYDIKVYSYDSKKKKIGESNRTNLRLYFGLERLSLHESEQRPEYIVIHTCDFYTGKHKVKSVEYIMWNKNRQEYQFPRAWSIDGLPVNLSC